MEQNELELVYNSNPSFRDEADETLRHYKESIQRAIYCNLDSIPQDLMELLSADEYGRCVFIYSGSLGQKAGNNEQKLYLHMVKFFEMGHFSNAAVKNKSYSIVFNNMGCSGSAAYNSFKQVFRKMPIHVIGQLKNLIILGSGMSMWAQDLLSRGPVVRFIKNRTHWISNINELEQYDIVVSHQILAKFDGMALGANLPEKFLLQSELPKKVHRLRNNFIDHDKYYRKESEFDLDKIFSGKELQQKVRLQQLQLNEYKLPIVLQFIVSQLLSDETFLQTQGIFRKSPSIEDQKIALNKIYDGDYRYILQIKDVHLLCSLLKKVLMGVPQPVFSFDLYQIILGHDLEREQLWFTKLIVKKMAEVNYNTLLFLVKFLTQYVVLHQPTNKMTPYNLGVVFAPCLLRARNPTMLDIQYAGHLVKFTQSLLLLYKEVFTDNDKLNPLFIKFKGKNRLSIVTEHQSPEKQPIKQTSKTAQYQIQKDFLRENSAPLQKTNNQIEVVEQAEIPQIPQRPLMEVPAPEEEEIVVLVGDTSPPVEQIEEQPDNL